MSGSRRRRAKELMAELERKRSLLSASASGWRNERRTAENRRRYANAAASLLADRAATGFTVATIADLRRTGDKRAVPVLVSWLPKISYLRDVIATVEQPMGKRRLAQSRGLPRSGARCWRHGR